MNDFFIWLNDFIRENSLTSVIIVSLVLNILYDLFKILFFSFIKFSIKRTNKWSLKNVNFLINHYKDELKIVEKISERDSEKLFEIVELSYNYFSYLILLMFLLIGIDKIDNDLLFYSFLGSFTMLIIRLVGGLIYNYRLIQKSKKFEIYSNNLKDKIIKLESIVEKSN